MVKGLGFRVQVLESGVRVKVRVKVLAFGV
jgi:hypothetical protein